MHALNIDSTLRRFKREVGRAARHVKSGGPLSMQRLEALEERGAAQGHRSGSWRAPGSWRRCSAACPHLWLASCPPSPCSGICTEALM